MFRVYTECVNIVTSYIRKLPYYSDFPAEVLPSFFRFFLTGPIQSVNGSSRTADCSSVSNVAGGTFICFTPASSILHDGNIPTLTGLDGDMWASQLLTLQPARQGSFTLVAFDFTSTPDYRGVSRVEVVMFNCPQYGISVKSISLLDAADISQPGTIIATVNPTVTSCDSLVRVCISGPSFQPAVGLQFLVGGGSNWVHLAEVTFHSTGRTCPPDTVITTSPIQPGDTTTSTMTSTIPWNIFTSSIPTDAVFTSTTPVTSTRSKYCMVVFELADQQGLRAKA